MMLKALPLVHFWSVLLLKEQMMTSVRKMLKRLVWSAQNRSISSEICLENNHKIGRFLPIAFYDGCSKLRFSQWHMFTLGEDDHVFKCEEMLFGVASKSETSLIFMKSICKMIVPRQELNITLETSSFSIWNSLQASFLGHSGSRAGKGRIACSYISGIWISVSKKWNADWWRCISNDVIVLGSCFSVCLHLHLFLLHADWRKSDGSVNGEQALLPFPTPPPECPGPHTNP